MNPNEFIKIKNKIENARQELSEKKAERKILIEKIKKELGVDSIDEAYLKLNEMEKDLSIKENRKEKLIKKIEILLEKYEGTQ